MVGTSDNTSTDGVACVLILTERTKGRLTDGTTEGVIYYWQYWVFPSMFNVWLTILGFTRIVTFTTRSNKATCL